MSTTSSPIRRALALAAALGLVTGLPLAVATTAAAAPATTARASSDDGGGGHAVFVLDDDPAGNGVIAFSRARDGSLVRRTTFATGGLGARLDGAVVDPLASQAGLTYDRKHGLLYAVNAGSDSVSVFAVHGWHLTRLQVVRSGGTLPVSVAVQGHVAYVLNAGLDGAISGFRVTPRGLVPLPGSTRSLGLANPALPNFLASPAQVAITPDGRHLLVTTKTHHTVLVWNLGHSGRPSAAPVVTTVDGVPFAMDFDRAGRLLLVNAAGTLSSWTVGADGSLATVAGPVADFGKAACWIATTGRFAYVANAGSATLSGYSVGADGSLGLLAPDGVSATTGPGPIDVAAADGVLYVENGGDGSLSGYAVGADGALTPVGTVTGLTPDGGTGIEGLVAI